MEPSASTNSSSPGNRPDADVSNAQNDPAASSAETGALGNQSQEQDRRTLLSGLASLIVIGSVFVALAAWSWRKWSDILVDWGNELYVPWRLVEGDVLYRDIFFAVGPASQYFNALLFQLFGTSATTLIYANLVFLAGIVFLIYRLFSRVADRFSTTLVCVSFLSLFGFSQYVGIANYNYICPYRHEMTHGLALCLLQIACLVCFLETRRFWLLTVAGGCLGAVALMKVELFVPSAAIALVGAGLLLIREPSKGTLIVKGGSLFLGGLLLPIVAFVILLNQWMPLDEAILGTFGSWSYASSTELTLNYPMYAALMGIDDLAGNVLNLCLYALAIGTVVLTALIIDRALQGFRGHRTWICCIAGLAAFVCARAFVPDSVFYRIASPLPLFSFLAGIVFLRQAIASRSSKRAFQNYFLLTLWSVLSLTLLFKMILNAQLGHYGFVLTMPATLLVIVCSISLIPTALAEQPRRGDMFRALMLGLLASWGLSHWQRSHTLYQGKVLAVGSGGDVFYHNPHAGPRDTLMPRAIDGLDNLLPEDATLLVLPYGVNLNYLLRKRNPTPHFLLTPWEIALHGGEGAVLNDIADAPPDFIVIHTSNMQGHGYEYFGHAGYGAEMMEWIAKYYDREKSLTGRDSRGNPVRFQVLVFKRKPLRPANEERS